MHKPIAVDLNSVTYVFWYVSWMVLKFVANIVTATTHKAIKSCDETFDIEIPEELKDQVKEVSS